jgi:probable phosphomutase (TIGR03848 family)
VATLILLRHAQSTANGSGVLAGRSPGVQLAETGQEQAARLVERLAGVTLAGVVSSPLLRCQQTIAPLTADRGIEPVIEDELSEVDYGEWTGKAIKDLLKEPLWTVVQQHPSAAVFPGGEGLAAVQTRAVAAVRRHDARIAAEHGDEAVWLACSHGDVIKAVLADALGTHLDSFQRIVADPCSVSVVRYTQTRPFVVRMNDHGCEYAAIVPAKPHPEQNTSDAVPGGTTGP